MNELRDVEAQLVPLDSLKAYDGNAKQHDSDNIDAIANSISEFGFRNPILAWHNEDGVPEIVAGHGRAAAAKKLRMEQVPVIFVGDLTDAQRRMLTLADNQTTLMIGWDDQTLQEELDALTDVFDVAGFGFDIDEIIGDDGVEITEDEPDDDAEDRNPDSMSKSELVDFVYDLLAQKGATTVLEFDKPTSSELHPTMKPVSLFAYQIMNSTRRGETVLDVFGGSGTSVVACEQIGRHCACVELDPHYASVIVDRWEKLTGGKAEKIEE